MKEVMSPKEFAEEIGAAEEWIREMCRTGQIPAAKVGKRWFIRAAEALGFEKGERVEK